MVRTLENRDAMRRTEGLARLTRSGFTLMEMLVVVAILVVLAGAAVPIYLSYLEDAKVKRARADVETLTSQCQAFKIQHGDYPQGLIILTQPQGNRPAVLKEENLLDPWGREYQTTLPGPGQHNQARGLPDIWSEGPNPGDPNSQIGNWGIMR